MSDQRPVRTRTELIQLLSEAAELEHSLACQYLFAAFTLKQPGEPGLTAEQARMVARWSDLLFKVATQEMLHLALACNLLTAVGGAPNLRRPNFPQLETYDAIGLPSSLTAFSYTTICRFMCWEKPEYPGWWDGFCAERVGQHPAAEPARVGDPEMLNPTVQRYTTIGQLYELIDSAFGAIPAKKLFIGPSTAQATNRFFPFVPALKPVVDVESAHQAIQLIVTEGEGTMRDHTEDCHFAYFNQIRLELEALSEEQQAQLAWPAIDNPLFSFLQVTSPPGANRITDTLTCRVGAIFTAAYDLLLQVLMRFFTHVDERDKHTRMLANAGMSLMSGAIRPLGVALARMPAGAEYPGKTAGPSFELFLETQPLPHLHSSWAYFHERLGEIADDCEQVSQLPGAPQGLIKVAMLLDFWRTQFVAA